MSLCFSTSWNAFHYTTGNEIISEIKQIGFNEVELSFNLTSSLVEDIKKIKQTGQIQVTSVHNFCPIPESLKRNEALPDCYSMASLDEGVRELSVKYTKGSIDTAYELGADFVVLHCGRVEITEFTKKLINLYLNGAKDSPELAVLKDKMITARQSAKKPFFENTLKSLAELNQYARGKNVRLGVETRIYYNEIPSFDEIGVILKEFKGANICYWHDTGHAQIMQNLGFVEHQDYLEKYAYAMGGIHLHDVAGCTDHLAPLQGELDFSQFKQFLKEETTKVIEAHHSASAEDLKKAKSFLEGLFDGKS